MDYTTEVVNITKIKDGFFLGDEATASNLDVIVQFKITHMINAAGGQIINAWETIGIKYLTLNWAEHSNQNLFDPRDEIANRIVYFIDDSNNNGEGLLVHSLRGQNRACLVILIYLIKKFRWTLSKSLEFLTNKKFDVQIPKYFLQQLSFFETRLSKLGQGPKSNSWNDSIATTDPEEIILNNTFLNGLINKPDGKLVQNNKSYMNSRRINWADNNLNRKDLCSINFGRDLILQKEIKPITSHKLKKLPKPCLKTKSSNFSNLNDVKKSLSLISSTKLSESTNIQSNLNNYNSNNNSIKEITNISTKGVSYNDLPNLNSSNKHSNDLLKNYTNLNMNNLCASTNLKSPQNNEIFNMQTDNRNNEMSKSLNMVDLNLKIRDNPKNVNTVKSNDILSLNPIASTYSNVNPNNIKPISNMNVSPSVNYNNNNQPTSNTRQNNFKINPTNDTSKTRSYSVGQEPNKNIPNSQNNSANDPKIIFASKYQNIVNNFNNIIIQSTEGFDKFKEPEFQNPQQNINRPNSLIKRDNNTQNIVGNYYNNNYSSQISNNEYMNLNLNPLKNILPSKKFEVQNNQPSLKDIPNNNSKNNLGNSDYIQNIQARAITENQKMMQNNFFSSANQSNNNILEKMKVIDHNTSSKQKISYLNQGTTNFNQSYNPQTTKSLIPPGTINKNNPINNYQPDLIKKNNQNTQNNTGILNRATAATKQGPVKIQTFNEKKPLTPDNNYNLASIKMPGYSSTKNSNANIIVSNYGTIKRSSSQQKNDANDRPSTAPQKEKDQNSINTGTSLKRLPSPMIKPPTNNNFNLTSLPKQNNSRQRAPSPVVSAKNSTITIGTLKGGSKNFKWK